MFLGIVMLIQHKFLNKKSNFWWCNEHHNLNPTNLNFCILKTLCKILCHVNFSTGMYKQVRVVARARVCTFTKFETVQNLYQYYNHIVTCTACFPGFTKQSCRVRVNCRAWLLHTAAGWSTLTVTVISTKHRKNCAQLHK